MTNNRVAIVTGGSRGIGRAIVEELATGGFSVVVNYATRPDAAEEVVAGITTSGSKAIAVGADVGRSGDRQRLIEATLEPFSTGERFNVDGGFHIRTL